MMQTLGGLNNANHGRLIRANRGSLARDEPQDVPTEANRGGLT